MSIDQDIADLSKTYDRRTNRKWDRGVLGDVSGVVVDPTQPLTNVLVRLITSHGLSSPISALVTGDQKVELRAGTAVRVGWADNLRDRIVLGTDTKLNAAVGIGSVNALLASTQRGTQQAGIPTLGIVAAGGMLVNLKGWNVVAGGTYYEFSYEGIDLTSHVPSAGMMRFATIFVLDDFTGIEVVSSTAISVTDIPLGVADVQECINGATADSTPAWAVRLVGGMTEITPDWLTNNVRDLRQLVNHEGGGGTVSPLTTKGDLYTFDTTNARLPVGTNGQILYANSSEMTGLRWDALPPSVIDVTDGVTTVADTSTVDFVSGATVANNAGVAEVSIDKQSPLTTKGDVWVYGAADARLPVGTNGQVLKADSGETLGVKWSATSSVGVGVYASLPAPGNAGSLYFATDSVYVPLVDNGAAWVHYHQGIVNTPPDNGDFSWFNQNAGAVAVASDGRILFTKPASNGFSAREIAVPSAPYTITMHMIPQTLGWDVFMSLGLSWRQSADDQMHTVSLSIFNTYWALQSDYWTDANTFSNTVEEAALSFPRPLWLRVADDGTDRIQSISDDGLFWRELYRTTNTDVLTPDRVGFYVYNGNADYDIGMTVTSWEVA